MEDPLDPPNTISSTSSSNNCTICFNEISEDEKITLNCNHYFCNTCIQDWFNNGKNSCPLCRSDITEYNLNDKDYRIVVKTNGATRNREINDLNRYLIKVNTRLKFSLYALIIGTSYLTNVYLENLGNIFDLRNKYEECNTNLTFITNNNILHDIGMYSLDRHIFRQCSIPKYFYDKCFMGYNYNE